MVKEIIRIAGESANPFNAANDQEFFEIEFCKDGDLEDEQLSPLEDISCNLVEWCDSGTITQLFCEYRATNDNRPPIRITAGFIIDPATKYNPRKEKRNFELVDNTHIELDLSPEELRTLSDKIYSDRSLHERTKDELNEFVHYQLKENIQEWTDFFRENPDWGRALNLWREKFSNKLQREFRKFLGGGQECPGNFAKVAEQNPKLLEKIVEFVKYVDPDHDRMAKEALHRYRARF